VSSREIPASWGGDADARWRYWLVDDQIDRRGSQPERYFDVVYEPLATDLLGNAGKFEIAFNPDFQTLTVHRVELRRDGVWSSRLAPEKITLARRETEFEQDLTNGAVSALIVLDDVRLRDVIRIAYTVRGENPILAGLTHESLTFAWADPIRTRAARVLFKPGTRVAVNSRGSVPQARIVRGAAAWEYRFEAHDIAAIPAEDAYPNWYEPYPKAWLAAQREWSDVAAWARTLYPKPAELPEDLRGRIEQWRALPSESERLAAALQAVQDEVRYFGQELGANTHRPAEPRDTWARRYGDCKDKAYLLVTLLSRLGISARPALVSANSMRTVADVPASADAFDHVIVQVNIGAHALWLDPTLTQQRGDPAQYPVPDYGFALPVGAGSDRLVSVARSKQALDHVRVLERLVPLDDGRGATLDVRTDYAGAAADRMRRDLAASGAKDVARRYVDYYRGRYGEIESHDDLAVEDDARANRLIVRERYALKEPWIQQESNLRAVDFYAHLIGTHLIMPSSVERQSPLLVLHPAEVEQVVEVRLPQGWRSTQQSESQAVADTGFDFRTRTEVSDDMVRITQSYVSHRDEIAVSAMREHMQARRRVGDALGTRIVLEMPLPKARAERERRLKSLMRDLMERPQQGRREQEN
jgi:transglutaminase-like putative cysteine protease